jgi:IS605 OrfB family transposase
MKSKQSDEEARTIETRLNHPFVYSLLEELLIFFSSLRHHLWRDLIIKKGSINELKKYYISHLGLTARHFNALAKELSGKALALEESKSEQQRQLRQRIAATQGTIKKLGKKLKDTRSTLKAIASYRLRVKEAKEKALKTGKLQKKPRMPAKIRGQFSPSLIKACHELSFLLHQKKRRLTILQQKLEALGEKKSPSLCFGGKSYFRNQFNLKASGLASHGEWRETFHLRRSSSVFFLGSSDETAGNQTLQYDPLQKTMRLRLPNTPAFSAFGTHLVLDNIEFPPHLREEFYAALSQPGEGARKGQRTQSAVSYRLLRRVNPHTGEKAYYLQATFNVPAPEKQTSLGRGALGVDLNADHVAVAETDRFGNFVDSFVIPFDLKGKTSEQSEAILGDIVAVISRQAEKSSKALVIEELDFEEKKKALREQPKGRRRFLSAFAYSQFQKAIRSKARSQGIELIAINPAYTSLIGAYKYQGLNVSSHEKASLAIARRAQGYSEGLKVFQGTLPSQVMMTERTEFGLCSRHVWGFYSDHRQAIRRLLIEAKRRPFLPVVGALSRAKNHPSLHQSLLVTWESRLPETLRCVSA